MHAASWVALGLAIAVLVLIVYQSYGRKMISFYWRPTLDVEFEMKRPYCVREPVAMYDDVSREFVGEADAYCIRFGVLNRGRGSAVNVEAYITRLEQVTAPGEYERLEKGTPVNLSWVHATEGSLVYCPELNREERALCKLGHVIEPENKYWHPGEGPASLGVAPGSAVFSVDSTLSSVNRPDALSYLVPPEINLVAGRYRLSIIVSAENTSPLLTHLEVYLDGVWHETEGAMWGRGLTVKVLS